MTTTDLRPPRRATPPPDGRHRAAAPVPAPRHRPSWEIPGLVAMLLGTGLLYLWNLSASGWANSFYAAAVQAGTRSWTAFFFGSLDSANAITVDKPPASLWAMEISARIFGFSSWSLLVPQSLMGVGAVALLWATVRRVSGPGAGLLACCSSRLRTARPGRWTAPPARPAPAGWRWPGSSSASRS